MFIPNLKKQEESRDVMLDAERAEAILEHKYASREHVVLAVL